MSEHLLRDTKQKWNMCEHSRSNLKKFSKADYIALLVVITRAAFTNKVTISEWYGLTKSFKKTKVMSFSTTTFEKLTIPHSELSTEQILKDV